MKHRKKVLLQNILFVFVVAVIVSAVARFQTLPRDLLIMSNDTENI